MLPVTLTAHPLSFVLASGVEGHLGEGLPVLPLHFCPDELDEGSFVLVGGSGVDAAHLAAGRVCCESGGAEFVPACLLEEPFAESLAVHVIGCIPHQFIILIYFVPIVHVFNLPQHHPWSELADVAVVAAVHHRPLEHFLELVLALVQSEGTVALHEVVDVHHSPLPEPVLAQPLDQGLQLVAGLEVRRRLHLVLHDDQVLIGVELLGDGQGGHCQSEGSLDLQQHPQHHLLVALVDGLVAVGVLELYVVLGQVVGRVCHQPELCVFGVTVVRSSWLVFLSFGGEPPHHDRIDYLAALLRLFDVPLLFRQFHLHPFFLALLQRGHGSLPEAQLPVLVHELVVLVDHSVEGGFVYLEEVVGDGGGVDAVEGHHAVGQVGEGLVVGLAVEPAQGEGNVDLFGQGLTEELVSLTQLLDALLELIPCLLPRHDALKGVDATVLLVGFGDVGGGGKRRRGHWGGLEWAGLGEEEAEGSPDQHYKQLRGTVRLQQIQRETTCDTPDNKAKMLLFLGSKSYFEISPWHIIQCYRKQTEISYLLQEKKSIFSSIRLQIDIYQRIVFQLN